MEKILQILTKKKRNDHEIIDDMSPISYIQNSNKRHVSLIRYWIKKIFNF